MLADNRDLAQYNFVNAFNIITHNANVANKQRDDLEDLKERLESISQKVEDLESNLEVEEPEEYPDRF